MVSLSLQRLVISDPANTRLQRQLFVIHWYGCTQATLRIRFMDILAQDFEATVLYSNAHLMAIRLYEYQMGYLTGLFGNLIALVRIETTASMNSLLDSFEAESLDSRSASHDSSIDAEFNERFESALLLLENRLRPSMRWPSLVVQENDYRSSRNGNAADAGFASSFVQRHSWRPPAETPATMMQSSPPPPPPLPQTPLAISTTSSSSSTTSHATIGHTEQAISDIAYYLESTQQDLLPIILVPR